jgi:enoyl-CoA hydratase/carnithine racemase
VTYQFIEVSRDEGHATVFLSRPERLNAYGTRMGVELREALLALDGDDEVKAVILTGRGRAFCVGHDMKEQAERRGEADRRAGAVPTMGDYPPLHLQVLTKPIIGAINGLVTGGGLAMALLCDVRIASTQARFSEIHLSVGTIPGAETWLLPRAVGLSNAARLIFTGQWVDAGEALRLGLVSQVVEPERLMPAARELATQIARMPLAALTYAKRALYHGLGTDLAASLEHVSYSRTLLRSMGVTGAARRTGQERAENSDPIQARAQLPMGTST